MNRKNWTKTTCRQSWVSHFQSMLNNNSVLCNFQINYDRKFPCCSLLHLSWFGMRKTMLFSITTWDPLKNVSPRFIWLFKFDRKLMNSSKKIFSVETNHSPLRAITTQIDSNSAIPITFDNSSSLFTPLLIFESWSSELFNFSLFTWNISFPSFRLMLISSVNYLMKTLFIFLQSPMPIVG